MQKADDKKEEHKIFTPLLAQNKNVEFDLQSKSQTWDTLNIPKEIQSELNYIGFVKPSVIQSVSIPKIHGDPTKNYLFQSLNGSGKTAAFGIPALMRVDPADKGMQVIILANTRELIRQTQAILQRIAANLGISISTGDDGDFG